MRRRGAAQGSRPRPEGLSAPQLPQPLLPLGCAASGWDADKLLPRTPDIAERGCAGLRAPPAELFSHAPDAAATLRVSAREAGLGAGKPASGSAGGCCSGDGALWAGSGGSVGAVEGQLSAWPAWSGGQAGVRKSILAVDMLSLAQMHLQRPSLAMLTSVSSATGLLSMCCPAVYAALQRLSSSCAQCKVLSESPTNACMCSSGLPSHS